LRYEEEGGEDEMEMMALMLVSEEMFKLNKMM
jgi:hypothetical protein